MFISSKDSWRTLMLKESVKSAVFNTLKYILISLLAVCYCTQTSAQIIENAGNWDDSGIWKNGNIGDAVTENVSMQNNTGTVTVQSVYSYTIGQFDLNQANTISVEGSLSIGDVSNPANFLANNSNTVFVGSSGSLVIWGDLDVNNNLVLTINGNFIVKGDVILSNGATLVVNGNAEINGDFTSGTGTSLTVNSGGGFAVDGNFTSSGVDVVVNGGGTLDVGGSFNITSGTIVGEGTVLFTSCTGDPDFCNSEILPVELISFKSSLVGRKVKLEWSTASELNNDYFQIERAVDGKGFEVIGKVGGHGTTTYLNNYSFVDPTSINQLTYYRLKQVDFDGKSEYLGIVNQVWVDVENTVSIYPNPASDRINFHPSTNSFSNLLLINANGEKVGMWDEKIASDGLDVSRYPKGTYFLQFFQNSSSTVQKLIIE